MSAGSQRAAMLFLLCTISLLPSRAQENPNQLAVGKNAKTKSVLDIKLNPVAEFNWKTRSEVLDMRRKEINRYPQLLLTPYTPYDPIWGAVEDKKPWWGVAGEGIWGSGDRSIEGPAEESRYILNPYMLVGVNPATLRIWNPAAITKEDISSPKFPFFWYPQSLKFDASKKFATLTINITKYQEEIKQSGKLRFGNIFPTQFSLVAYNARDLGYTHIWLNNGRSINVSNDNRCSEPTPIRQMLHCGGTCGYRGGCNNMSPFMKEIDRCRFNKLPARACVYLWRGEPATVEQSPDFIFLLEFI